MIPASLVGFPLCCQRRPAPGWHADSSRITDITETPITWGNWYKHVNWLNTTFIIFVPLVGLISSYWVNLHYKTAIFAVAYYYFAGLGISMSAAVREGRLRVPITDPSCSCRLPSPVGSLELQGHPSPQDLPRRRWRCRR